VKSVHHFWFGLSALKSCFSRFSNTLWGLPGFVPGFLGRTMEFPVHIFMDSGGAVAVSFALQIGRHAAVAVNTVVFVVDLVNLLLDFCFLGAVICLSVFPVVVVGIRAQAKPSQQPANAEFFMILVDKSVSL